ncbi:Hypothetical predicted protein [Paramuricea clavata]|uniref:Uncharacterized protein n=1 Tax=Paramuricea clavata TaxID=317549 RepID=A0A6S7GKA7_PARCT|nr:Hypothetical predicted protein [Paramuricea clavata]
MAQADTSIVTRLRNAILNICRYPRGCRRMSDITGQIPSVPFKEGKEMYKILGDLYDEDVFNLANNCFDNQAPFQLEDILVSGSVNEGTHKVNLETKSISDTDFMLILKNIKVTKEDQKKGNLTVKENTAFVNLYLTDQDLIKMWADFLETSSNARYERSTKLSSMKLKERFREKYITYGPIFTPLSNEYVQDVDEGPSIAVSSKLPDNGVTNQSKIMPFPVAELDFVLAIKCDGWPLCAQEWLSRPRCWPNQDIVQTIVESGFHIVCKRSSEGDFRLSYYNAETILIQKLSDLQHKTYRAFKSFVKHYKNEWSSNIKKILCSYHLKTILLWYCEKSDPSDWTEERIVGHLLSLIDDLISALKERNLPMYFMPKYNLMEQMDDSTEVVKKIADLRFSLHFIIEAIISEEPNILEWANFVLNSILPGCSQPFEKGIGERNFDPNDFLQYFGTIQNLLDESWINAAGEIPTRNDVQGKRAMNILLGPFLKFMDKCCKSMNHILPK